MKYYQELTIIPNDDIAPYVIWSKLYTQLHIALADIKNTHGISGIGVSFPNYRYHEKYGKGFGTLGNKLRVFADSEASLALLDLPKWLDRLSDYVHIKRIDEVGDKATGQVVVVRYRMLDVVKKAQRFAEFKGISFKDALEHCLEHKTQPKPHPFIALKSQTNGNPYRLTIWQYPTDEMVAGKFNSYGTNNMSSPNKATVPHW